MNATKLGLRLTSSVLATALCFAPTNGVLAAPAEDGEEDAEGEETEGEDPEGEGEGEEAEGEEGAEGEEAEGEDPEGEGAEGEEAEGEETEGGETEGEEAEGEETEGEEAEGEEAEGEEAEGEETEGEGEEAEVEAEIPTGIADGPQRPPEPAWGPKKQYPMNGKGMLITGGIVTGLGAAFIVTSVLVTRCDFDTSLACKYGDQRDFLVPSSIAATALGVMLIGVGIGNRMKYKKWENWTPEKTAVAPALLPGGGGIAVAGKF